MDLLKSAILGLLQGLTEFLPISSSGHIVLAQHYLHFNVESNLSFVAVLHMGTLVATILVFRKAIYEMVRHILKEAPRRAPNEGIRAVFWNDPRGRLISAIIIGSIPTAIIGALFKDMLERIFVNVLFVTVALALTGALIYSTRFIPASRRGSRGHGFWTAIIVGTVQGIAIAPGISRSGSTITAGLWMGLDRGEAGEYSFLLSIPAITGALLLSLKDISTLPKGEIPSLIMGAATAFVAGYISLRWLLSFIKEGKIHYFAWYCWLISALSLICYFLKGTV